MNQNNLNFLKRPWQFEDYHGSLNLESSDTSSMLLDQSSWNDWHPNSEGPIETVDQNGYLPFPSTPLIHNYEVNSGDGSVIMPSAIEAPRIDTCFGAVRNTVAPCAFVRIDAYDDQIPGVHTRLRSQPPGILNEPTQSFCICSDGAYYGLSTRPSEVPFSVFNKKTCEVLRQLLSLWQLRLEAHAQTKDLRAIKVSRQQEKSPSIVVDINVYGAREDSSEVGRKLFSFGITLQQPLSRPADTTYYNPHFLHTQELFGQHVTETPFLPLGVETSTTASREHSLPEIPRPQLDTVTEVNSILNSLSHHSVLHKQTKVNGLKTTLKE